MILGSGYIFKAFINELRYNGKLGLNGQTMAYAQCIISKKMAKKYDVAIGYMELWADAYVLNNVKANKVITWIHTDYANSHFVPDIDCKKLSKADAIVCVSEKCLENLKITFPTLVNRISCIENILSYKYLESKLKEEVCDFDMDYVGIKIITVCRLSYYTKGLDRIIWAITKLRNEGYDFRWYIVGEGGGREQLEKMISDFGLKDNLILLGKKINPYPYYKKCDVYVMPSRYEGKPMSVTEAQMLGLPVIVTKYASAEEQVYNNIDGIIVENNDTSIYLGIKKIFEQPELLNKYKENLKNRQLSNEYIINKFYMLLEQNRCKGNIT